MVLDPWLMYNTYMTNKYTLNKSYGTTHTGRERVHWNVVDSGCGTIIDTFSLRRDAKYYMDLWNSEAARNGIK